MGFRIKGKNWKRFHCCGRRRVLKTMSDGQAALVCPRCGKGHLVAVKPVSPNTAAQEPA